jgi:predicted MFS family arabinose efflux permease
LIGGMTFTFIVGSVIDYYEAMNNTDGMFIFCSIGVFGLMLLHTCTLLFSKEKVVENSEKISTKKMLGDLIKDKKLIRIIVICCLWSIANYATTPFYGTYQIKELGFTMTFVSILSAMYSIVRSLVSKPLGRYADKYSFVKMLNICFAINAALLINKGFQ